MAETAKGANEENGGSAAYRGRLTILSGPSGAGKTSLARALAAAVPDTAISISHTTRPPRPGERDGVDYHFVSPQTFQAMVREGRFLEHARVFDHCYGTSRAAVEAQLRRGRNVLLDIDWQGARAVRRQIPSACSIFILPPSRETLAERLRGRGQDSEQTIARRMRDAVNEMRHAEEFDYIVVNDDFQAALKDIRAIIEGRPEARRAPGVAVAQLLGE